MNFQDDEDDLDYLLHRSSSVGDRPLIPVDSKAKPEIESIPETAMPETPATSSIYKIKRQIKRDDTALRNRLLSIIEDSKFVDKLHEATPDIPIFCNLRCGVWYLNPANDHYDNKCYFKSTDGHSGVYNFPHSRMNLHVVSSAALSAVSTKATAPNSNEKPHTFSHPRGCFIIDSTRKGKEFPDSLTRTIPIWCCVLNRVIAKLRPIENWDDNLYLPSFITESEKAIIASKIDEFDEEMISSPSAQSHLRELSEEIMFLLRKPLRAIWISRKSIWNDAMYQNMCKNYTPIICVSVSSPESQVDEFARKGWKYIQGAGDDEEHWCPRGFTRDMMWKIENEIEGLTDIQVDQLVEKLIANAGDHSDEEEEDFTVVLPEECGKGFIEIGNMDRDSIGEASIYVCSSEESVKARDGSLVLEINVWLDSSWSNEPTGLEERQICASEATASAGGVHYEELFGLQTEKTTVPRSFRLRL